MSITVTTLNNEAAASKTFSKKDGGLGINRYINATDSNGVLTGTLEIRSQLIGKNKQGAPIRRSLVQSKYHVSDADTGIVEEMVVNLTITSPESLISLNTVQRKDLVAYIRNLVTGSVVDQLARGEV